MAPHRMKAIGFGIFWAFAAIEAAALIWLALVMFGGRL